ESGEAQVLRDLAQRTLDRARELRIVDLPPDEPGRDEQECDDEQAVDHRRDTQTANGAPPVLREEDGPDHGAQPEDQGGESDRADDALRVPKAVVADRLRDVAQAVVEPARALLVASAAARPLEAARDQRERGTEVESLPATSALLDDGLVRAANRVPEDRLERVGVDDALERKLERGAEARCLLVPGLDELGGQPSRELRADGLGVERLDGALAEGVAVVQGCPCPVGDDEHRERDPCHDEQYRARHPPHRAETVTRGARRRPSAPQRAEAADQRVRAAVVVELAIRLLELRNDFVREHLAELDAPLVERVDLPDRPLG